MRFKSFATVCLALACILMCGYAAPVAGTRPGVITNNFPARVEQSLQIEDSGADVMPALAKAIEQQKGNPADAARAIGTLVDSLLAGPHPTALLEKILPTVELGKEGAQQNLPKWSYGSYSARVDLINSIWGLAQAMVKACRTRKEHLRRRVPLCYLRR